jgi:Putative auto-transporter adhesin, head GIN domain
VVYCPSLRRHYPDQVQRVYLSLGINLKHPGTTQNYTFRQFQKNYLRNARFVVTNFIIKRIKFKHIDMKQLFTVFGILFIGLLQAQDKLIISDPMAVKRDIGRFSKIEIHGPFKVYYSVSDTYTVAVSANSASARDRIRVKNNGGVLVFDLESSYRNWISGDGKFKLYISAPTINEINASGAVNFLVTDLLKSDDLKIKFTGASDFLGKLDCGHLHLQFTGASDVELTGRSTNVEAVLTGASKLKASTFKIENADIKVSGASNSTIFVSNKLHAVATGASNVHYYGNPTQVELSATGASKVKRAD